MLKAFKSQLGLLATENGADFAKQVRSRLGRKTSSRYVSEAMNLIMIMPDLIAEIRELSDSDQMPKRMKPLNGFLLAYLYHPIDFLPEEGDSIFGYLDDAYFVGQVYNKARLAQNMPTRETIGLKGLSELLSCARQVIPKESKQIDKLLEELEQGKRDLFDKLMKKQEAD